LILVIGGIIPSNMPSNLVISPRKYSFGLVPIEMSGAKNLNMAKEGLIWRCPLFMGIIKRDKIELWYLTRIVFELF